ncbi:MAG: 6,7-dimethyl-8-ribityllumazine synthase [Deltaproteobacteria bacterium]|nr:6,7-dimethyl-8-ribityllumazine synthase [Deltaproteobacteria bacterium]
MRIGIVVSRFNGEITQRLLDGAQRTLLKKGASKKQIIVVPVPGCFELPVAAKRLGTSRRLDAILCLGVLIRGETSHFDWIASAISVGLVQVGVELGIPVIFGVLTTDTEKQALERAGGRSGHKGVDAAYAAIEMIHCFRSLRKGRRRSG